jgi:hypothetical protein
MVYQALLPLMRTPTLPVVDRTDAPADLNGLVRFAERRNLVSARVPPHFKRSLPQTTYQYVLSGFCREVDVNCAPLGYYAASSWILYPFWIPDP